MGYEIFQRNYIDDSMVILQECKMSDIEKDKNDISGNIR